MSTLLQEAFDLIVGKMQAELESKAYWDEVSSKLEAFYKEHAGLKQLLAAMN